MEQNTEGQENAPVSAETQAVLDSLKAEGYDIGQQEPSQEPAPSQEPEAPAEAPPKEEAEPTVDRSRKEPALIPAWEHKVAQKRWEKERDDLLAQLEAAKVQPQTVTVQQASDLRSLAEQHGLVLDDSQEKFFKALLERAVPQDVAKTLETLQKEREIQFLENQYEQEFAKDVVPTIRDKYGDLSEEQLAELKGKLHDKAFTETYAKVPLKKIFLAEAEDMGFTRAEPKATVQAAKSGKSRAAAIDFDTVTEDDAKRMSPGDFEKYVEHQIAKSGGSPWRR